MIHFLLVTSLITPIHEWYSQSCCGRIHCHPVPCDQLVEDNDGWVYLPTHNHFYAAQVFPSQDRFCHVCIDVNQGRSLCAYVRQGS